jgi:cobalamin biosynthesis protein CobT
MAATKKLAKFTVTEAGEDFNLHIEDEAGHVLELSATRDQVDVIADKLDELLSQDDSADEIEDDEVEDDEDEVKDEVDGKKR